MAGEIVRRTPYWPAQDIEKWTQWTLNHQAATSDSDKHREESTATYRSGASSETLGLKQPDKTPRYKRLQAPLPMEHLPWLLTLKCLAFSWDLIEHLD